MNFGELQNALGLGAGSNQATLQATLGSAFVSRILNPFYDGQPFRIQVALSSPAPAADAVDRELVSTGTCPFLAASRTGSDIGADPPLAPNARASPDPTVRPPR